MRAKGGTAVLIACAIALQGCVTGATLWDPVKTQVDVLDRTGRTEVRSLPAGATVRDADGNAYDTPARVRTRYRVRRTGKKHRMWVMGVAACISVTIGALALAIRDPDDEYLTFADRPLQDAIAWVFLTDAFTSARVGPMWGRANLRWKKDATYERLPTPNDITVEWKDFPPLATQIEAPKQAFVTVRRPTLGTFDEALIHWERTSGQTPSTVGMLELGHAYARLAQTGGAAYRAKAISYYEKFLATGKGTPDQIAAANRQLAALRAPEGK